MKDQILNALYSIVYENNKTLLLDLLNVNPDSDNLLEVAKTLSVMVTDLMTNNCISEKPFWDTETNDLVVKPLIPIFVQPYMARPVIISAANLLRGADGITIAVPTPRHSCTTFHNVLGAMRFYNEADDPMFKMRYGDCQGFIDQMGNYYTRSQAMELMRLNMQPFNYERNGGGSDTELYSEGKY